MSQTEVLIEKAKTLTPAQTEVVLQVIETFHGWVPRGRELLNLPREVRRRLFQEQIARAGDPYTDDPDLIIDDKEAPLEYD
jgi:hypothetical protein